MWFESLTLRQLPVLSAADSRRPISEIGFEVGTGGTINMNGKVVKVKDLQMGDLLTFWVPEGVYGISPTMAERPLKIVKPTAMH